MTLFDDDSYEFHEMDSKDRCFRCGYPSGRFFVLRQVKSMKMVHLCEDCLLNSRSDYYLDNTRPWSSKRRPPK